MHSALLMAKREYMERVRSRAFRVSTLVVPLAFGAIFGIGYLSAHLGGGPKRLVVASNDRVLAESVAAELRRDQASRQRASATRSGERSPAGPEVRTLQPEEVAGLNRQIDGNQIDGYLWIQVRPGGAQPNAVFASRSSAEVGVRGELRDALGHAFVREELRKRGLTEEGIEALLKDVNLKTVRIKDGKAAPSDAGKSFWGAYVMAFLLYLTVLFYGVNVAHSIAAEKTSRVFEVLLASAKPSSLLAGKLIGVGGAGLTQLLIWVFCAALFSSSSLAAQLIEGGLGAYGVTSGQLFFLVVYFLFGFFLYSSLSAGLGAAVSQESEVQQFNMLIMLPQIVSLILIMYILGNPTSWPVVVLSLVPWFTPIAMCLRMSVVAVPWWQIALSIVLMTAAIVGTVWLASRIYRVGILMYGKRPTLPEMLRWLRYS